VDEHNSEESARAAIEEALADIKAGVPFEEVADKHSDCAGNGGDLGWFPRGEMVEEFEEIVFNLPIGGMSDPFRSSFGFHIAKVYGRKPPGVRPLADVREEIVGVLNQERQQKALEDYLDALRAKADIRQSKSA
jgi:parvulin-like peptidyl-prolyl isomerase